MMVMWRAFGFASLLLLCGCASIDHSGCLLRSEKPMVEAQLFFGRDIAGRAPLSDMEWAAFAATVLTKDFPDGFTVSDGEGQWRDPQTGAIVREQSKIVLIAADNSPALAAKLGDVVDAYRTQFHQQSVGVITRTVCAAF
jgi:hypothetical protein